MIRKLLNLLLAMCLFAGVITAVPITGNAATEGDYTYWIRNGNAWISDYNTSVTGTVTIPSTLGGYPVTTINEDAFWQCIFTEVIIPDSITTISNRAFYDCTNLTSITIGANVETIDKTAFFGCCSLTEFKVDSNNSVYCSKDGNLFNKDKTTLLQYANGKKDSLYEIPNTVINIGDFSFYECENLKEIHFSNSVKSIGSNAFDNCIGLVEVNIGGNIETVGNDAFYWCTNLTKVNIDNSVITIGENAFYGCSNLSELYIGDNVSVIGEKAFSNCGKLESITIPSNVTSVCESAFSANEKLKEIVIENGVKTIENGVFSNCTSLTNIEIPDSITSLGDDVFYGCESLISIEIPNNVVSLGKRAFASCYNLTSIIVGDGVPQIGESCFEYCSNLKSVKLGCNIETIGTEAFYECDSLTSIAIPDSVRNINGYAFYKCDNLNTVILGKNVESIGGYCFAYCKKLLEIDIPDSTISIGNDAFIADEGLRSVKIGDGVTSIGSEAFYFCYNISKISLGTSVKTIGDKAFSSCDNLTDIYIPTSVTSIGSGALSCLQLKNIYVAEDNLYYSSLNGNLYNKDKSILLKYAVGKSNTTYTVPSNVKTIAEKAFYDSKLEKIIVGNNVTNIEKYAFYYCYKLNSVILGDGITSIPYGAFIGCSNLKRISISQNTTYVGQYAFYACWQLDEVYFRGTAEQWGKMSIATRNGSLTNAIMHYKSVNFEDHSYENNETVPVTSMSMLTDNVSIYAGEWVKMPVSCYPTNATDKNIKWSSSDSKIATVNDAGIITGKTEGYVTITAKSHNGLTVQCDIYVMSKPKESYYSNYMYSFDNSFESFGYPFRYGEGQTKISDYKIPFERYIQAGLSYPVAALYYNTSKGVWGGSCFGISASSMLFSRSVLKEENYDDVHYPVHFDAPNSNNDTDKKLRQMIELFQVSQHSSKCKEHYNFSCDDIMNELDWERPVLLSIQNTKRQGHAVVIYDYIKDEEDNIQFKIYDSSGFVSSLYRIDDGLYFEYENDKYTWFINSYTTFGDIYNIYSSIESKNRNDAVSLFSLSEIESYITVLCSTDNLSLTNSSGKTSTIIDGEMSGEIDNVKLIRNEYLTEEQIYTIILPIDTYTLVGNNDEVITTSFADNYMSASVTVKSNTPITISRDLKKIDVDTSADEEYNIKYTTYNNIFDEMTLAGTAKGEVSTTLNDTDITITGINTLGVTASVSDVIVSTNSDSLANSNEITVKYEKTDKGATIQILSTDAELTEKTVLPERLTADAPNYDLNSGTYTEGQVLTFSKDDDTIIYYTIDGSIPSADNGIIYSLPIDVNKSMTIKAIGTKYGYMDSEVIELNYTLPEVDMPQANIKSGEYDEVITVDLSTGNYEDEIYYTLDGSNPLQNGILYTVPINISEDSYLQAYTLRNGCISEINEFEYTVSPIYPFYFSNSLTNQYGEVITPNNIGSVTKVKMTLSKLHTGDHTGMFLIAFYGADNRLIYTNYKFATISEDIEDVEIDITGEVSAANKIKVFAWKDLSNLQPICEAFEELIVIE